MLEDDIQVAIHRYREMPIIQGILTRLEKELPKDLIYHAYNHTEDVLKEAVTFAVTDSLPDRETELLVIAAAYHDAGFIKSPVANEPIGASLAREAMEKSGEYSADEIRLVEQMILDTALVDTGTGLRQIPTTDLSRYLLDADLSNFGREDFFDKGELQRQELGHDRAIFLQKSFELLNAHRWLTNAGRSLRQRKKEENLRFLRRMVPASNSEASLGFDRLGFLARLPLLLNSSLDMKRVITVSLEELKKRLDAEAATIFILEEGESFLTFWALKGEKGDQLEGTKMPASKGIVGWVVEHQESVLVDDVAADPRFFSQIDKEAGFTTRNVICAPLTVRGTCKLGAVQVLNKRSGNFDEEDLEFLEQFSHQAALAIDNARLYEAVSERNRKLEVLDNRKNEMMSVIAHEFRTPLNLIGTSAELLAAGTLSDSNAMEKMCGVLNKGVQRLTKLIAEIKNLSLSTRETLMPQKTKVAVRDLVQQALEGFTDVLQDRRLSLQVENSAEADLIEGDFGLLVIALRNLVANAIRFTPDGGIITVTTTKTTGTVHFQITDTGIGIDAAQHALIFEKFFEVGPALNHSSGDYEFQSGGLGLGLATTRAILRAHGSTCEVKSALGQGSTFSFSLPIA